MRPDDAVRIGHIIEACEACRSFVTGRTRADLNADLMLRFALVRSIEIVGEAASKVTAETRSEIAEIPWPSIVAMRNRLVHAYFDIDLDVLWKTATEEIPALLSVLPTIAPRSST